MNDFGIPIDQFDVLSIPPSVVLYGAPGAGKSFEMARAFPKVLYVQSSPSILHALADYAAKGGQVTVPDRVTIDERTVAQHFGNSTLTAVVTIVDRYIAACDSGKAPWEGIVFDEWSTLCERIFAELKLDPWGKFKGRSGAINIFAVMDAFKGIHRSVISLARRTRKVVGFVSHHQAPKVDDDENSPTKGLIKWRGGPKMPMGLSDQMVELCADADIVLQLAVEDAKGNLLEGTAAPAGTVTRKFYTSLDEKWFRKVRGFVDPVETLDFQKGKGLRELIAKAGYPV